MPRRIPNDERRHHWPPRSRGSAGQQRCRAAATRRRGPADTGSAARENTGTLSSFALAAEERGFHSVWAGDSLLARPVFDPFTVLSAAAAVTRRVLLGTAVLLAPMRPPVLTAQAIASLDQLSGGRLIIGVGRGFDLPETRREFAAAGADFATRTRRLRDTVALWRRLWSDGRASMDTEYSRLDDEAVLPLVSRPGGPPVWLAGFGPNAFADTGRLADGWLPYPPTPDEYRHGRRQLAPHRQAVLPPRRLAGDAPDPGGGAGAVLSPAGRGHRSGAGTTP
jgi:alkanesulfonate monooxygenase SsuD/methylene tetrahydromethanopterin reductase-like flavin-dependent oxidoreductase (luciferase family)